MRQGFERVVVTKEDVAALFKHNPFKVAIINAKILILFYSILFYSILSYSILFYSILFYPILSYLILSYPILSYPIG